MSDEKSGYLLGEGIVPTPFRVSQVGQEQIQRRRLSCSGCGHQWWPRTEQPKRCPNCSAILRWPEMDAQDIVDEFGMDMNTHVDESEALAELRAAIGEPDPDPSDADEPGDEPETLADLLGGDDA